jgi:hypothetical protein
MRATSLQLICLMGRWVSVLETEGRLETWMCSTLLRLGFRACVSIEDVALTYLAVIGGNDRGQKAVFDVGVLPVDRHDDRFD